ncbi:MAG TPA: ankyrin repeat domain-containing protein [Bryobacteraceae bacterium]|nr:ankyrin repeat domain-containing protein [Bryobacteraceae bacterium]
MSLLDAIKAGDATRVQALLTEDPGAATARTPEGVSLISVAMYHRQPAIAALLAAGRTDLDLFDACALGDRVKVAELLEADPGAGNSFSPDGFAPIALAAFFGHSEIVEDLASAGVDVNAQARNPMKVAAIHAAVAARDARSVEVLLRHGADANLRQQNDYTPLQAAEQSKDETIISLLKEHGAR